MAIVHVTVDGVLLFIFSSRRRHTRSDRDWNSDVCSSDLIALVASASAASTGAMPFESTSHNKKRRIPVALAFRKERTRGAALRTRPMGKPRNTVKPADRKSVV